MISLSDKNSCCGCGACAQTCPHECITFHEDEEGFLYPSVSSGSCIGCGACEAVCPMHEKRRPVNPVGVFAIKNAVDVIRFKSSSGGVFYLLACHIIKEGGVVFGARFNESWEVEHKWTDKVEGLEPFMGSKYVQSKIGLAYVEAEAFLKQGRAVLFSGTPCQIAGLQSYLNNEYDQLLLVSVVCHGVPSPMVWRDYLFHVCHHSDVNNGRRDPKSLGIKSISFRDKRDSWKHYGFSIHGRVDFYEDHRKNLFMRGFLSNLFLRPACYDCKFKGGRCGSDIVLGDFWGVQSIMPEIDDDKGVNLVLANTEKGMAIVRRLNIHSYNVSFQDAIIKNPCLVQSISRPTGRDTFYRLYDRFGVAAIEKVLSKNKRTVLSKIVGRVKRLFVGLLNV